MKIALAATDTMQWLAKRGAQSVLAEIYALFPELASPASTTRPVRRRKLHWTQTAAGRRWFARRKKTVSAARITQAFTRERKQRTKKPHWTQTAAGKARMSRIMRAKYKAGWRKPNGAAEATTH